MASILAGLATAAATAKAVKELADKATGGKASGTVSRITGGGSAREERETQGGGTATIRSTPTTNGYPDGPYTQKYTGGNAELDAKLADLGRRYNAARDRALAGDKSAVTEMRNLNDWANQYRNQYGYAAEYAEDDLSAVKGQINYYGGSGGGSGSRSGGGTGASSGGVNDYSEYIEEMNRAQQEAALAELRAAYEKNLAGMDRTQQSISPTYQSARNQAAGNAARQQQAFNEFAAAYGLNSGTAGQAQLAMSNALQGNLSGIDTAEANALSDLELQRSQAEIDYNNAIAQAKAEGNYQLAQQLYTEKVRVDEALQAQIAQAAQNELARQQMAMQQSQQDWENQFALDQYNSGKEQQDYQNMVALAQEMAKYGDFSGYQALGIDTSTMEQRYAQEQAAANAKRYSSGGSGGSGGSYKPMYTASQVWTQIENGNVTPQVKADFEHFNGISYDDYFGKNNDAPKPAGGLGINGAPSFGDLKRTIVTKLNQGDSVGAARINEQYYPYLTEAQRNELENLYASYGY